MAEIKIRQFEEASLLLKMVQFDPNVHADGTWGPVKQHFAKCKKKQLDFEHLNTGLLQQMLDCD